MERRLIRAGWLVDGSGGPAVKDIVLTLRGGIIEALAPFSGGVGEEGLAVADFSHCTVVPALVDCSLFLQHSHAAAVDGEGEEAASRAEIQIGYCHAHGVLGVADGSGWAGWREDVEGHGGASPLVELRTAVSADEVRVPRLSAAAGPRPYLRLAFSADIGAAALPQPRFSAARLGEIVGASRRLADSSGGRLKTVVVANGREQIAMALQAGCEAIEQGYGMGEDNLREMARRRVLWIPSLLRAKTGRDEAASGGSVCCRFSQGYASPGTASPEVEARWRDLLGKQLGDLRLARELGVKTAVGSGAGSPGILHGESVAEEMRLFAKAGYPLVESIRCAAVNGASFYGMDRLGALKPGARATFLLTRGTPSQLPRKLAYLEGIFIAGRPSPFYSKLPS